MLATSEGRATALDAPMPPVWVVLDGLRGLGDAPLRALRALARLRDPTTAVALTACLSAPYPAWFAAALGALATLEADPATWDRLIGLRRSPDAGVRTAVMRLLGLAGGSAAQATLKQALTEESAPKVRAEAYAAQDAAREAASPHPGDLDWILSALASGEAAPIEAQLGRAVGIVGHQPAEFLGALQAALESGARSRAILACRLLRGGGVAWGPGQADACFEAAAALDRPVVARHLAPALSGAQGWMRGAVLSGDSGLIRAAAQGLGWVGELQDSRSLTVLARTEDPRFAAVAWDALAALATRFPGELTADDRLRGLLVRAAGAPDVEIRRAVCRFLPQVEGLERLGAGLRTDPDPWVRSAALRAEYAGRCR